MESDDRKKTVHNKRTVSFEQKEVRRGEESVSFLSCGEESGSVLRSREGSGFLSVEL
jgi:hypothetical protein